MTTGGAILQIPSLGQFEFIQSHIPLVSENRAENSHLFLVYLIMFQVCDKWSKDFTEWVNE